ncbi:ATP-binding cassette domain-containing protein [Neobacillus sp. SM06]|uniref:ATP-binding cassette domain-containing protein n=1 Tax=Neobacillus sp. SM06 TaxID=3422492 RepID=UPI003D287043
MIELINLTKSYKDNLVLEKLNIKLKENKISFIMGENGVGKTTLLKCLLKLEKYKGIVLYDGKTFDEIRKSIHVIYDDSPLYLNLSGFKNIELLSNKEINKKEIKNAALKYFSEEQLKTKVKSYSYGQRKKISLVIAELSQPKYLFMDEVSNGLDYETMTDLKRTLKEWSKKMTIIATGHQFEFYAEIIDELFIIKQGTMYELKDFRKKGIDLGDIYTNYAKQY